MANYKITTNMPDGLVFVVESRPSPLDKNKIYTGEELGEINHQAIQKAYREGHFHYEGLTV